MDDEAQHIALLQILGIENLSKAQQDQILDGLEELTDARAMAYLHEMMPEAEREHFVEMVNQATDDDELLAYVTQFVPNAEDIMARAADEVINEFLDGLDRNDSEGGVDPSN